MKVDATTLSYIHNVVSTASQLDMDCVIIEPGRVRGTDEQCSAFILQTTNVPELEIGSVGINRIDIFNARYAIAKSNDNVDVDALLDGPADARFVRALTMKSKRVKVDYRCANPATIRAPKGLADTVAYTCTMSADALAYMAKSKSAMDADEVTFMFDGTTLSFFVSDINGDKLSYAFDTDVGVIGSNAQSFQCRYPLQLIQKVFKINPAADFNITSKGILKTNVNTLDVYVLPRK